MGFVTDRQSSLMRYEDQLRSHPNYFSSVLSAIGIYVRIHDQPDLTEEKLSKRHSTYPTSVATSDYLV